MSPPFLPRLSSLLVLVIFHIPTSNGAEPAKLDCRNTYDDKIEANYTNNDIFHTNLKILIPSLISNVSLTEGFYNTSIGEGSDKVYGLVLCRGDATPDICKNCTDYASNDLLSLCRSRRSAIWYDLCQVQYSDSNFFDFSTPNWWFWVWSGSNMIDSELEPFNNSRAQLMRDLANKAAYEPWRRMFATGELNYSSTNNVFGLMQCKPVISAEDCHKCLEDATSFIPTCCDSRVRGRVFSEVCSLRFEISNFFGESLVGGPAPSPTLPPLSPAPSPTLPPLSSAPSPTLPPLSPAPSPTLPPSSPERDHISSRIIVILIPTIAVAIILSIIVVVLLRKKKVYSQMRKTETSTKGSSTETSTMDQLDGSAEPSQFGFETIRVATNGFSDGNKLGKGGFGPVYKGKLLDGIKIAVKRLSIDSEQGEKQFMNEVELISKLQHKNLVQLHGWCVEGQEKLLIYEYIPNGSLDYFLFGTGPDRDKCPSLNWEQRFKIVGGIARGLVYLHEDSRLKIIHRDLKASNILLDVDMVPRISDFGLAKIFEADQTRDNASRAGTFGYMAPEYERRGELSVKSDVFSFGVLLLEIVSGRKNAYESNRGGDNLISYVWKAWIDKTFLEIIDSSISEHFSTSEVERCIHIGLLCVQEDANSRPIMSSVVTMLTVSSLPMPTPSTPAFLR